jgi:hypothetical protein
MIKSTRLRWAGHVAHMGQKRNIVGFSWKKKRDHWEDLDIGGKLILKLILERYMRRRGLD